MRTLILAAALMTLVSPTFGATSDADTLSGLRERASALVDEGRDDEALPLLDQVVKALPENSPTLGTVLNDRGLARWNTIATPNHTRGEFAALQARLCLEVQTDCEAIRLALADLDRSIALQAGTQRAVPYANRAEIRFARGDRPGALADEDESLRLRPESDHTHARRAAMRLAGGDKAGALADLDAALRLGDDTGILASRAALRRETGDADGARADLDEALRRPAPSSVNPRIWHHQLHSLRRAVARPGEPGMEATLDLAVEGAELKPQTKGSPVILVTLAPESVTRFRPFTKEHVGSRIDVSVDGRTLMRPIILSPIEGNVLQVAGSQGEAETEAVAARLKGGAQLVIRALD